ncbi:hypothetical protein HOD08_03450 [bacterium]|nr:hypothetical protein [bacterium]
MFNSKIFLRWKTPLLFACAVLFTPAHADKEIEYDDLDTQVEMSEVIYDGNEDDKAASEAVDTELEEASIEKDIVEPDKDEPQEDANIHLNFEESSLGNIIEYLTKANDRSYIPNKDIDSIKVSLQTPSPLTKKQAWEMLLTMLEINSFSLVDGPNDLCKIVKSKDSGKEVLPIYSTATGTAPEDLPDNDQMIRYVYFMKNNHLKSDAAAGILSSMFQDRTSVEITRIPNVLIVREKSNNIKSAMRIIKELDQGGARQSIKIVKLQHADPTAVAKVFSESIIKGKYKPQEMRFIIPSKREMSYFSETTKIIPDPARRALILMGHADSIDKCIDFIKKIFDKPLEHAQSRIHIKEIKHLQSEQLQRTLDNIIKPPSGMNREQMGDYRFFEDVVITAESPQQGDNSNYGSGNRLIVACGAEDWQRLERLIDKLDKPKAQIALEVLIADVEVEAERELSAQLRQKAEHNWGGHNLKFETAHIASASSSDSMLSRVAQESMSTVFSLGNADNIWGVIKATLRDSNTSIVAQPFLVAKNREQCVINSGEKRLLDGGFGSNAGHRSKERVKADNRVEITPRINGNGIIDLSIKVDFSDFASASSSNQSNRELDTRVCMGTGEVLVLGGLKKSKVVDTQKRTPFLSKIPIVGNLFKSKNKTKTKTSLYIFIRASIIKPRFDQSMDDYTRLKIDYAKYQVVNKDDYANSKDPIDLAFFKPQKHGIKETIRDTQKHRFEWIDDFAERKEQPKLVELHKDPYYRTSESMRKHEKKKSKKNPHHKALAKLKTRAKRAHA